MMPLPDAARVVNELPRVLRPALAPLVRSAMGVAVGGVMAAVLVALAVFHAVMGPEDSNALWVWLLGNNFFPGYAPSFAGAALGLLWGFGAGFPLGWLIAQVRNWMVALWMFWVGARERIRASKNVLEELM